MPETVKFSNDLMKEPGRRDAILALCNFLPHCRVHNSMTVVSAPSPCCAGG